MWVGHPNGLEQINKTPVIPEHMHSGFRKALIKEKRQEVLAERNKHIQKSSSKIKADPNENDVKIIDRSYLQKSFKAKSAAAQKKLMKQFKSLLLIQNKKEHLEL